MAAAGGAPIEISAAEPGRSTSSTTPTTAGASSSSSCDGPGGERRGRWRFRGLPRPWLAAMMTGRVATHGEPHVSSPIRFPVSGAFALLLAAAALLGPSGPATSAPSEEEIDLTVAEGKGFTNSVGMTLKRIPK